MELYSQNARKEWNTYLSKQCRRKREVFMSWTLLRGILIRTIDTLILTCLFFHSYICDNGTITYFSTFHEEMTTFSRIVYMYVCINNLICP